MGWATVLRCTCGVPVPCACRSELQDLHRIETLPQMVALSEAYIQFYEQQDQQ